MLSTAGRMRVRILVGLGVTALVLAALVVPRLVDGGRESRDAAPTAVERDAALRVEVLRVEPRRLSQRPAPFAPTSPSIS